MASLGVVVSLSDSSSPASLLLPELSEPLMLAPYPASVTAFIICSSAAAPSTPIELVSRLTEQLVTPGTLDTAFSTLA